MRIGFLGGSFNPVHHGHIAIARRALEELSLDRVLLIVASEPPHKEIAFHVSGAERFQMLARGLEGEKGIIACDIELGREGKSYTFDTARLLKKEYPGAELYCVLGADMLFDLPTWYRAGELLREVSFFAFARGGLRRDVRAAAKDLSARYGAEVRVSEMSGPELSSTEIRERVYAGRSTEGMLPEGAARYLYENGLYVPDGIRSMQEKLKTALNEERYAHSMGTVRAAAWLAERYGVNLEKARLAALLHDCAKADKAKMLSYLERFEVCPFGYAQRFPGILHGPLGSEVARADYGVTDPEVLMAIANHTACSENMSALEKITYLADKIEPTRDYLGVEAARAAGARSLDEGVLACMDYVLAFLREKNREIDPCIFRAREYIYRQNQ